MPNRRIISRRYVVAMSAASVITAAGGFRGVSAQSAKRIEQLAPELDKIVSLSEPILELASGVGGDNGPAEGPLWWKEGGYLLFSDIHNNRRMKYTPGTGTNGTLARQTDRVFAELGGPKSGVPDGMKVDSNGNVYCGGSGGIYILDPKGKKLGRIVHGQPQTTNLAFGGQDWRTLYFTNWNFLGSVNVKIPGVPVPVAKKA